MNKSTNQQSVKQITNKREGKVIGIMKIRLLREVKLFKVGNNG